MAAQKTHDHEALELLIAAGDKQKQQRFDEALALTGAARALMRNTTAEATGQEYYPCWGWIFEKELALLEALGRPADMLAVATDMTENFRLPDDTLFGNDLVTFRSVLRQAHGIRALDCLARQDTRLAIRQIEAGFKVKAGIGEYLDPFEILYDIRAQVYCQAYDADPKKYRKRLFSALHMLQKKEIEHDCALASERPKALFADPAFLEYQQSSPLQKLLRGKSGEPWKDAIKRFARVVKLLKFDEDQASYNELTVLPPETDEALRQLEAEHACTIPASLRRLYLEHGAVELRDADMWGSLSLYGKESGSCMPAISGLMDGIDSLWGGRPEFEDSFSAAQLDFLNAHYFVFGHIFHHDNAYTHLFFSKSGACRAVYYHQDQWYDALPSFEDLLTEAPAGGWDFDSLFSEAVDDIIASMVEWKEEQDNEA